MPMPNDGLALYVVVCRASLQGQVFGCNRVICKLQPILENTILYFKFTVNITFFPFPNTFLLCEIRFDPVLHTNIQNAGITNTLNKLTCLGDFSKQVRIIFPLG